MRLSGRWLFCGAAVLLLFAAGWFYYRLNVTLRRGYAPSAVIPMLEEYVGTHAGEWPSNWDDLRGTQKAQEQRSGLPSLERDTIINFELTSEQILRNPELIYTSVESVGGEYALPGQVRLQFDQLLNLIRDLKRADSARSQCDSPLGRAAPKKVEAENAVHP